MTRSPKAAPRRVLSYHPVLFAVFPVLALFAANQDRVRLTEIIRPVTISVGGVLALWLLCSLAMRHTRKGAVVASIAAVAFFSYGHVLNGLPSAFQKLVLPVGATALLVLFVALLRTKRPLVNATRILNVASAALVLPSLVAVCRGANQPSTPKGAPVPHSSAQHRSLGLAARPAIRFRPLSARDSERLPDVYYIVLDAYGRDDALAYFHGFDNTAFLKELERRGFYVARESRSNYMQTPLCVASTLNMTYLTKLAGMVGPKFGDIEPVRALLDDNAVANHLRLLGYRYVHVSSGAGQTRVETADILFDNQSKVSNFEEETMGLTALSAQPEMRERQFNRHREQIEHSLDNIGRAASLSGPKFVFAHVLAPHPPFVFGPRGESRNQRGQFHVGDANWLLKQMTREEYSRGYTEQLAYINRRILQQIDTITERTKRRPIVVLQGDHGSRMNVEWESLEGTDLREPFSILNAYLVPNEVRRKLMPDTSPVNSFRIILSAMFGGDYPVLSPRSYFCPAGMPYDLTDVTASIGSLPNSRRRASRSAASLR